MLNISTYTRQDILMRRKWLADITSDSNADFSLYIELLEEEEARACVRRDAIGQLELYVYRHKAPIHISPDFVRSILAGAERDLR